MVLTDIFEDIYIIHLSELKDRKEKFISELNKINVDIKDINIIEGITSNGGKTVNDRITGCKLSHVECLKRGVVKQSNKILVMEDDICFHDDFNKYLPDIMSFLDNNDWDMFYFGGNVDEHMGKDDISKKEFTKYENIIKCYKILTTHCYAVNFNIMKPLLNIKTSNKYPLEFNDDLINVKEIQSKGKTYIHIPRLAYQTDGFSYIRQGVRNYMHLFKDKEGDLV